MLDDHHGGGEVRGQVREHGSTARPAPGGGDQRHDLERRRGWAALKHPGRASRGGARPRPPSDSAGIGSTWVVGSDISDAAQDRRPLPRVGLLLRESLRGRDQAPLAHPFAEPAAEHGPLLQGAAGRSRAPSRSRRISRPAVRRRTRRGRRGSGSGSGRRRAAPRGSRRNPGRRRPRDRRGGPRPRWHPYRMPRSGSRSRSSPAGVAPVGSGNGSRARRSISPAMSAPGGACNRPARRRGHSVACRCTGPHRGPGRPPRRIAA